MTIIWNLNRDMLPAVLMAVTSMLMSWNDCTKVSIPIVGKLDTHRCKSDLPCGSK